MNMKAYLYKNVLGVFAIADDQILAFEPFPRDAEEIANRLEGVAPEEGLILKRIKGYGIEKNLKPPDLDILLDKAGATSEEYYSLLKEVSFILAKKSISKLPRGRMIIQAVEAQDDLEEALNILSERIREWYSLHFPELDSDVEEHQEFVELIEKYGARDNFPEEFGSTSSIGAILEPVDIEILKRFASEIVHIYEFKDELNSYIESAMEEVAPNVSAFAGPIVGAKLLSQAKSLENLAKMPASRVQVLGAKKAMFKHMKHRANPPKHGVIFQHPSIKTAPWWQRGKIARSFSGKAAIAAKADAFSGEYIADGLKRDFKKRLKEIKEQYPPEPKKMRIIRFKPEKKKKRKGKKK
jgi:nucleolar protein 56